MKTGPRPSSTLAVKSKCCDCRGGYLDGRQVDCKVTRCPLYKKMPYRTNPPDYVWVFGKYTSRHINKMKEMKCGAIEYIKTNLANRKSWPGIGDMFRAKCFDCCNNFADKPVDKTEEEKGGRGYDCQVTECPLYWWQPYRKLTPSYDWILDLECNKKHETAMIINCMTREEYLESLLGTDKDDAEDDESNQLDDADSSDRV